MVSNTFNGRVNYYTQFFLFFFLFYLILLYNTVLVWENGIETTHTLKFILVFPGKGKTVQTLIHQYINWFTF